MVLSHVLAGWCLQFAGRAQASCTAAPAGMCNSSSHAASVMWAPLQPHALTPGRQAEACRRPGGSGLRSGGGGSGSGSSRRRSRARRQAGRGSGRGGGSRGGATAGCHAGTCTGSCSGRSPPARRQGGPQAHAA